jgi:hypothetical protein
LLQNIKTILHEKKIKIKTKNTFLKNKYHAINFENHMYVINMSYNYITERLELVQRYTHE